MTEQSLIRIASYSQHTYISTWVHSNSNGLQTWIFWQLEDQGQCCKVPGYKLCKQVSKNLNIFINNSFLDKFFQIFRVQIRAQTYLKPHMYQGVDSMVTGIWVVYPFINCKIKLNLRNKLSHTSRIGFHSQRTHQMFGLLKSRDAGKYPK